MTESIRADEPWYRNPWVWLLIAIPSLTVVGCMITIYLALSHPHIIVSDSPNETVQTTGDSDTAGE